jgi:hypothetical protein
MLRKGVLAALVIVSMTGSSQGAATSPSGCAAGTNCVSGANTPDTKSAPARHLADPGSVTLLGVGLLALLMRRPRI